MTIIIALIGTSLVASALVVSACVLSSRFSQQEGVEETYAVSVESETAPATPFSLN